MRKKKRKQQQTKILILSANPIGTSRLRVDEEVRDIEEGLQRSKYRDRFKVDQKGAMRLRDLRRVLLDYEPQILHFTGHGELNGLLVEDKQGFGIHVPPRALTDLLRLLSNRVECILLNACYSDNQADTINKYIKYVIGIPREIKDKAALEFAVGFYDALGAGKPVDEAYKFGCNAIRQYWPEIREGVYPKLHVNQKIRFKKKNPYTNPVLLAFCLVAAFFIGLNVNFNGDKPKTVDVLPGKKIITEPTVPEHGISQPLGEESQPEASADDPIVYITRTGHKYHRDGCRHLSKSKIPIKRSEAKKRGYTPCSVCIPP